MDETKTYRVERSRLLLWLGGMVMLGTCAVYFWLSVVAPESLEVPAEPGPTRGRALLAAFATALTAGFVLMLITELGARLTLGGDHVEHENLFHRRRLDCGRIIRARWRGRGLTLRTAHEKLTIDVSAYASPQRAELIHFFRLGLPEEVQSGWERFWRMNWRVFDRPDPKDPEYLAENRRYRRRIDLLFLVGTILTLPIIAAAWHLPQNREPLAHALLLLVFWPLLRRHPLAAQGKLCRRLPRAPDIGPFFLAGLCGLFITLAASGVLMAINSPACLPVFFFGMGVSLLPMVGHVVLNTRRTGRWQRETAALAEREYLRRPGTGGG